MSGNGKSIAQKMPWVGKKVLVVGDIILDEYVIGYVDRISPEAPVPVLNQTSREHRLGGAANVALNIKRLGGEPLLLGVIGGDEFDFDAAKVEEILMAYKMDASGLIREADRLTTLKTRFVTEEGQQLLRVDSETTRDISDESYDRICSVLQDQDYDAIVLADYNKGVLRKDIIDICIIDSSENGKPSIIDPNNRDYAFYAGCTLITPNRKEAAQALKVHPRDYRGEALAHQLRNAFKFKNVLVTLGSEGMALLTQGAKEVAIIPSMVREVYDVSGAGDTVTAMMALGLACGLSFEMSARFATHAAGIAVEHQGTYAPSLEELIARGNP